MKSLFNFERLIILSWCCIQPFAKASDSEAAAPKIEDQVRIEIAKTGWSSDQKLVLAVRIHAKTSEPLELSGKRPKPFSKLDEETYIPPPFTLATSYLIDEYTGAKIAAEKNLPNQPRYGPMQLITQLGSREWIQLGVAFPKPTDPPLDRTGKLQPYKLSFHAPLEAEPITFTIPIPK